MHTHTHTQKKKKKKKKKGYIKYINNKIQTHIIMGVGYLLCVSDFFFFLTLHLKLKNFFNFIKILFVKLVILFPFKVFD